MQSRHNESESRGGHLSQSQKFFCALHFLTLSTISHFGKRFRDGQYTFVSFLFAVLLKVPAQ